jgi:ADP-ribose pyrophosphatase
MIVPAIIGREVLLDNEWLQVAAKVVRGVPGSRGDQRYYVIRPHDYVCVVATTPDQQIILVRQYRPAVERFTLEIPSGLLEPGESPHQTALRELREETGYVAEQAEHIGTLVPDTGRYENRLWCYVAAEARLAPERSAPEEGLEPVVVDVREMSLLMRSSEFDHALHVAALMLALTSGHLPGLIAP